MKLKKITDCLEKIAPLALQEQYDNAGLITGSPEMEVKQALVCIDSTEDVIDEAVRRNCNLIIAHHPIIFRGIKKLTGSSYAERALIKAIRNNIAIYAIHTNLDNAHNGVNARICERLGLLNCKVLSPKKDILRKLFTFCPAEKAGEVRSALFEAGCGHIGNYAECSFNAEGYGTFRGSDETAPYVGEKGRQNQEPEVRIETVYPAHLENKVLMALFTAHPYEEVAYDIVSLENRHSRVGSGILGELEKEEDEKEFLQKVKQTMNSGCIKHTGLLGKKVKKVAVCGGAGSHLLKEALAQKAGVFITSDFKYHQFFDAENKIVIADIGHYESEHFTKELIADLLKENFPTFATHLSEINTNPVKYL